MREFAPGIVVLSLHKSVEVFAGKEMELGRLDAVAGDGDHGATMLRGLRAAVRAVDAAAADAAAKDALALYPAGELLVTAGDAFADAAGGASGALFGALLTTVGRNLAAADDAPEDVCAALQAGAATVAKLGKTVPGDKTMLDALAPFVAEFAAATARGLDVTAAWHAGLGAAAAGAAATAGMAAKRGRASRLGERSVGSVDPGAQSVVYLFGAFDDVLQAQGGPNF
jgi:dihydroxyacetone kinase